MKESAPEALIHNLLYAIMRYKKQIAVACLLIVGLFLAFWGWETVQEKSGQEALTALYQLQAQAEKAKGDDPTQSQKELLEGYRKAVASYGDSAKGKLLHYEYAKLLLDSGAPQEAIPHFQAFLNSFAKDSPYRGLVGLELADCAERMNDFKQAKVYLEEAEQVPVNPQKEFVLFALARVELKLGEKDKAKTHLEALIHDYADSPLLEKARDLRLTLDNTSMLSGSETHSLNEAKNRGQH